MGAVRLGAFFGPHSPYADGNLVAWTISLAEEVGGPGPLEEGVTIIGCETEVQAVGCECRWI